ncbi:hypothetical protein VTO42DRAFT_1159 [Malbranchea cinnamomea]
MELPNFSFGRWVSSAALLANALAFLQPARAVPIGNDDDDPFAILDPQNWVNPDNMTWDDWRAPPDTNWADPTRKGSIRNFNIALVTVDYPDMPFVVTLAPGSTVFGNPQPSAANIKREDVPTFYHDFLNKPGELNRGHTLHEYWMEDSMGRYGVDLTAFGPYRLPAKSYQYGIDDRMNPGSCPSGETCNIDLRTDALGAWRKDVGNATADSFELVFILSAGQDESSTWQEFGEMKFQTPEDVPDEFGPPTSGNDTNYATTRYIDWTSWASASCIWPNAGGGSSTQSESSGMGTFAHELSHLLDIGDNYNNPYGDPPRRSYTGPWSMLSRGSFNGPGGPHTRWQIPPVQGGSMGSLHTLRDKDKLGLVANESIVRLSRESLPDSGVVVARLTARAVAPGKGDLMGIRIAMDADNSPPCDIETDPFCDGGDYDGYDVEVIDRMGADSFTPDSGVMISKTRSQSRGDYQWTIDANPQDIGLVDFYRPDGTPSMVSIGDYRQLSDALFHAGTRSGSQYEYVDEANGLHFYIVDVHRDKKGVLSYTAAVKSTDNSKDPHKRRVFIGLGKVTSSRHNKPTGKGVTCSFPLLNTGSYSKDSEKSQHPQDVSQHLKFDVYRLKATVTGHGWKVELPNALSAAEFGKSVPVKVAVAADKSASLLALVKLTATSESDPSVSATGYCLVTKYWN